ncbi:glycosyltransferase [Gordonia phage GodonK]|uniref:Glycosyltransferase n=1 Tax=Gordonia phage GodonK TaxID=2562192 RepID=A0A4D6E205_9CAUD|nr:glycosyltransferase [Gordonia phage GodonK]QBZ72700.1 glycosyltransferase [Gordonia phage GodonK]
MAIDLSILVCSTNTRWNNFGRAIQEQIWTQYDDLPDDYKERIEIQILTDNKKLMLGEKRNIMVDSAQGKYVQFIDDDDRIEPDMFKTLLDTIAEHDTDVITFLASVVLDGGEPKICRYSINYSRDHNTSTEYHRLPNHICCVKRDLAKQVSFPNVLYGEDSGYSKLLKRRLKSEYAINRVLYHYDYNSETTETQLHRRASVRRKRLRQTPLVDVVVLSNASTQKLQQMTQHTIDTCLAGANGLSVNVIVMEQASVIRYKDAVTHWTPDTFHYNRFANAGANTGSAEWIMIANNDLVFHDGWLHELLAAEHPVVSPHNPGDPRQRALYKNEVGTRNGRHFSGWCFMVKRELWKEIGGFDECVSFWCSDDVVIEQVKALDVHPMIVPKSVVKHLGSVTLNDQGKPDSLTWEQYHIYVNKYNVTEHDLLNNPRYRRWKKQAGVA